ncbi:MAG TPA: GyrI-like domain-containing protein [bacterium]|nr:GyrI-like domain-containing protein [bacterium]HPR86713.1 GyrI-like domain-containing protein [bacterium]
MKALRFLLYIIVGLAALLVILGLIAPKSYRVERSMEMTAPPQVVFFHVQYWTKWQAWLPWGKDDVDLKITYKGVDGTAGSSYSWIGTKSGSGEMSASTIKPAEELAYHLKFITPMASEADGFVRVAPAPGGSKVTWAMFGRDPFPWNILMLFMSMDKMIGKDFERGLTSLKEISEKDEAQIAAYIVTPVDFPGRTFAALRQTVAIAGIPDFFTASFGRLMAATASKGLTMAGPPCGLYYTWDEKTQTTEIAAALPISGPKAIGEGIELVTLPKARAFVIDYYGPYDRSMLAYQAMDRYFARNNLRQSMPILEEYVTDPGTAPDPAKVLTRIYFFAR